MQEACLAHPQVKGEEGREVGDAGGLPRAPGGGDLPPLWGLIGKLPHYSSACDSSPTRPR